jgi:multidrug efflux pump subunit AcrA (membrane-fusion protein)
LLVVIYYGWRAFVGNDNGTLKASGTIEPMDISLSRPEWKIAKYLRLKASRWKSDPVLKLDDSLLIAQKGQATAGLEAAKAGSQTALSGFETAKSQYQSTLTTVLAKDSKTRLQDWFTPDQNRFDQPNWYFTREEQIQAAQTQIDEASRILEAATKNLQDVANSVDKAAFLEAEQRLMNARLAYLISQDVDARAENSITENNPVGEYNRTHCGTNQGYRLANGHLTNLIYRCSGDENLSEISQAYYDDAKAELESAEAAYGELLNTQVAEEVLQTRAEVSVAQERYYASLDRLHALQTGDESPVVSTAKGAMDQAQAGYEQSLRLVEQAEANLRLIETQLDKLTVLAPVNGVILTRNVEPGEFVQPGAIALTMANLNELTITVYIPEDRYGVISIGQEAKVKVDSFPDQTFTAEVVLADDAEFTRLVQTVEGRGTVYRQAVTDTERLESVCRQILPFANGA